MYCLPHMLLFFSLTKGLFLLVSHITVNLHSPVSALEKGLAAQMAILVKLGKKTILLVCISLNQSQSSWPVFMTRSQCSNTE